MKLEARPWDYAEPKEINHLIRSAALATFENALQTWESLRNAEGWSDDDVQAFRSRYSSKINAALERFERWIVGKDISF